MEKFERLLETFCSENDCEAEIIKDDKYGGRLVKVTKGKTAILHRVEHLMMYDCTDDQIRRVLLEIKGLFS